MLLDPFDTIVRKIGITEDNYVLVKTINNRRDQRQYSRSGPSRGRRSCKKSGFRVEGL